MYDHYLEQFAAIYSHANISTIFNAEQDHGTGKSLLSVQVTRVAGARLSGVKHSGLLASDEQCRYSSSSNSPPPFLVSTLCVWLSLHSLSAVECRISTEPIYLVQWYNRCVISGKPSYLAYKLIDS